MGERAVLRQSGRWVVKIGTSLLTEQGSGLNHRAIDTWVEQIADLCRQGIEFIVVSSGSIGAGMERLGWAVRPREIHKLQAVAAVGQMQLVQAYATAFKRFELITAQVLLTHADLADRERYLNARSTLRGLLRENVIPVVNENDTVVNDEIRFGDNDTLAALVCNLVEADLLVILTDQQGLYDRDPRHDPSAQLVDYAQAGDPALLAQAGPAARHGRGGMLTKVMAAQKAARSGASTVIACGREAEVLRRLRAGEQIGTLLHRGSTRLAARKQWLAGQLRSHGRLVLDDGAVEVLCRQGKSLLPIGVVRVEGRFARGEIVVCVDQRGREVACGLVNYRSDEVAIIAGKRSREIESLLGYGGENELIHRDNIAITRAVTLGV